MKPIFVVCVLLTALVTTVSAQVPASRHVVVVVEENHNYSQVIGTGAMPYLNSLANQYGLATQYYANTHPSIGNYFMMTTGQIITNNDNYSSVVTADNLVRHLLSAGKTWKSYAEGLPSVGYVGGDTGLYVRHHNPFTYLSDVFNSSAQRLNLVPFGQFTIDLNNNALPDISFVIPNLIDDAPMARFSRLTPGCNPISPHCSPTAPFFKTGYLSSSSTNPLPITHTVAGILQPWL